MSAITVGEFLCMSLLYDYTIEVYDMTEQKTIYRGDMSSIPYEIEILEVSYWNLFDANSKDIGMCLNVISEANDN